MSLLLRLKPAADAAFKHLLLSLLMAGVVAALVFGIWYPGPYGELAGGQNLFLLIVAVDVVCGPLLTLVIYNSNKPRAELVRDIGLVALIQLTALGYGLDSLAQARPVWLAFEKDLFRVVSVPDLIPGSLAQAPQELQALSFSGPKILGVRIAESSDPDFFQNVQLSMAGYHPAFRPERWIPYTEQADQAAKVAHPLAELQSRHAKQTHLIDEEVRRSGREAATLGYLPLATEHPVNWVVLLDRRSGEPVGYLPLDGWKD
ncbi:MAG: TfpX/TfpZ family type IV pilin accessory protein [Hydrogenophaga sp.]|uniref:TfpX/TfpZ family type IV pilin accessory protein n=1 Tax=Hydrogenophaga sp. TaxID=1904254 RepID=UPI002720DA79|nr:TfpX/TfpZ family type IV pilin accessory protein [Hydrogenophaga sp.]MDO9483871.1 TfpX/TfpZ family type IV pilin accessory protein [Hydrogenophaga sp.]MDP2219634.1 TfpX/TfpZ family type IV pilin accessory protein [Hydrogenophaga sp.]MDP3344378.1 TfpX/TfpZ family type IV pilin accessory protein [Hydrogenophaga sp.]MDP3806640.1 TfpX/TfpZ family type IV pilin accessory protein [Hydrogenophaga sp.]MDP3923815.1 TfpX/TfpZ family type IV pilin accessory protein [Hydrogenophaga sp.]